MSQEYGPKEQYDRKFSDNKLLGDNGDGFFDLPIDEQVNAMAWSEGCPVREKVKARYVGKGEGLEGARDRYGEVIMARLEVYDAVKEVNPALNALLTNLKTMHRFVWEPVGEHEAVSVPESHTYEMDPNNTPWGYAIPRLYLMFVGNKKERTPDSSFDGLMIAESAAEISSNPYEYVLNFGSLAETSGADIDQVLKTILSNGYLNEENTQSLYRGLLYTMQDIAPKLWNRYTQLKPEDRARLGIADINIPAE